MLYSDVLRSCLKMRHGTGIGVILVKHLNVSNINDQIKNVLTHGYAALLVIFLLPQHNIPITYHLNNFHFLFLFFLTQLDYE